MKVGRREAYFHATRTKKKRVETMEIVGGACPGTPALAARLAGREVLAEMARNGYRIEELKNP